MIKYALKCSNDHSFESWFASGAAFDTLKRVGHVTCPQCGSSEVEKALMAPKVTPARKAASIAPDMPPPTEPSPAAPPDKPALASADAPQEAMLQKMRKHIEDNSDYVGGDFAKEARAMHLGDVPDRAIHGEASLQDAKELLDDGISVMPLPFTPKQKQQ